MTECNPPRTPHPFPTSSPQPPPHPTRQRCNTSPPHTLAAIMKSQQMAGRQRVCEGESPPSPSTPTTPPSLDLSLLLVSHPPPKKPTMSNKRKAVCCCSVTAGAQRKFFLNPLENKHAHAHAHTHTRAHTHTPAHTAPLPRASQLGQIDNSHFVPCSCRCGDLSSIPLF